MQSPVKRNVRGRGTTLSGSDSHGQAERERLRSALDARTRTDRDTISYRGYRFERPEWLRRQGSKTVFRIVNRHGVHVENLVPSRFTSPDDALEWVDALIDEDPESMAEWMSHPLARLTSDDETVRS